MARAAAKRTASRPPQRASTKQSPPKPTRKAPSAEALELMEESGKSVTEDKLAALRRIIVEVRDIERELGDLEERVKELSARRNELLTKTLPDSFQEVGVTVVGVEGDGNLPPVEAELTPFYSANIAASWPAERKEKAFAWLIKQGHEDVIKTRIEAQLGRGDRKTAKAVEDALRKLKVQFQSKMSVPHTTLTALVRDMHKAGQEVPTELLGATIGQVVKIKEVKEKK